VLNIYNTAVVYGCVFQRLLGTYTFLPFIGSVAVFGLFTWWQLPETKNRTINEVYRILRIADTRENDRDEKV